MSANLFGERFSGKRVPAWHNLGQVFQDEPSIREALLRTDMDYEVKVFPQTVEAYGTSIPSGKWAIVREPTKDDPEPRILGYAGEKYGVIQNLELAEMLEPLTKEWPVETVGALGNGETIFICLLASTTEILGDEIREYFMITDPKTGLASLKVCMTPVRTVCENTLVMGLRAAASLSRVPHKENFQADTQFHLTMMMEMRKARDTVRLQMERMAQLQLNPTQRQAVLEAAYPGPTKPRKVSLLEEAQEVTDTFNPDLLEGLAPKARAYAQALERAKAFQAGAAECYDKLCDEYPKLGGTGWALYNAIVECSDYRSGGDDESVATSTLFGPRAQEKVRGFEKILSYA